MKFTAVLITAILFATNAHALSSGLTMLEDAAILHDQQQIRTLIDKEVQAEHRRDFPALDKAISALSKATDPLTSHH
jgi:hypothetical protein